MIRRKKVTLMPAITLVALSAMVAVPTLSNMHLYAASATTYALVTVQPGDTLWSIASRYATGDVNDTIDRITEANHLSGATIRAGQQIRVPK